MSSLWTPSGERPVPQPGEPAEPAPPRQPPPPRPAGDAREPSEEEMAAQMQELTRQLVEAPAAAVVANHAMGLFELAALHLSQKPPKLDEAQLAIDAMAALVEGLPGRLGPDETTLRDGLAQLRLAFVQLRAGSEPAGERPPS